MTFLLISTTACAQTTSNSEEPLYYQNIENSKDLGITAKQREQIQKVNREITPKFREIGNDRSTSGYEKGQRKRALALEHKKQIFSILTPKQQKIWQDKYGNSRESIKDNIGDYADVQLENLENKYKADKKAIDKSSSLSKDEKKYRKNKLEATYKIQKQKLKDAKEASKRSGLLDGR